MELLIIKTDDDYIRVKDGLYEAVGLDKARVFPMEKLDRVKTHLAEVRAGGFPRAAIYRLCLTEKPLEDS